MTEAMLTGEMLAGEMLTGATLEAYRRWAPLYPPEPHNALMRAEQRAMLEHWPDLAGRHALDLACGSGRYSKCLADSNAASIVAVDFCLPMVAQVQGALRVCAGMMQLPFASGAFEVVVSGLALGHADDIDAWMSEVARVLRAGGTLLYSDFHPEAARLGLARSFQGEDGCSYSVPHRLHEVAAQKAAAAAAGFTLEIVEEVRVGAHMREPSSKSQALIRRWEGLPIVLVVRARK
jgi:malonyl-CoA O-methyltransferase